MVWGVCTWNKETQEDGNSDLCPNSLSAWGSGLLVMGMAVKRKAQAWRPWTHVPVVPLAQMVKCEAFQETDPHLYFEFPLKTPAK